MQPHIDRRRFLSGAVAACAGGLLTPNSDAAVALPAPRQQPLYYRTYGFDERYREKSIIRDAMDLLHTRFRSTSVLHNAYQMTPGAYHLKGGYWRDSLMHRQRIHGYADLLWFQIINLASLYRFPDIHIHAYHKPSRSYGKADVGRVKVRWRGPQYFDAKGSFKIHLNRYHLGAAGRGSEPATWAAVIAHEMLHNLGHMHGRNDYRDHQQMIAFEHAVYWAGDCWRGRRTPLFECG